MFKFFAWILSLVYHGWLVTKLWSWFIAPLGAAEINVPWAVGLLAVFAVFAVFFTGTFSLYARFLTGTNDDTYRVSFWYLYFLHILMANAAFVVGFIAKIITHMSI